jgi:hypothetical protein
MNTKQGVYRWQKEVTSQLWSLNGWQQTNVALFSYGVAVGRSCHEWSIVGSLKAWGSGDSLRRRLPRFLANKQLDLSLFFREWTSWVLSHSQNEVVYVLVDETKIDERFGAMVVGWAYEGRCIPLAWRVYRANSASDYPSEGQVQMIASLLEAVKLGLPDERKVVVLADRGIGTSPALMRAVMSLDWYFLFRVTRQSKLLADDGQEYTIYDMVERGGYWSGSGLAFKQRGRVPAHARVLWDEHGREPWALFTNDPTLTGFEYAYRHWQEQAFRDLKSRGWQWDATGLTCPQRVERLLILLVVAYAWMLSIGCQVVTFAPTAALKRTADSWQRRLSLFHEGLAAFAAGFVRFTFAFWPDPRFVT